MGKYQAESIYIASIYPGKLETIRLSHGADPNPNAPRCTTYELKPVKKGKKPHVLEVVDSFENVLDVAPTSETGRKHWISKPVACEEIVDTLLKHWAGNFYGMPEGAGPGIMRIVGTVPTQAEIQAMTDALSIFAEYHYNEAERLWRENDTRGITQTMRDMAEWLGRKTLWSNPEKAGETMPCPACYQSVPSAASICHNCGTRLKELPADIAALNQVPPPQRPVAPPLKPTAA